MKRFNLLLIFIFTLIIFQAAFSYSCLYIRDPRAWGGGQGTIEEAVFSIRPRGLYMECGMYLTFSANGLGFSAADSLEVEFYFDLPKGSIVHDSWLWIEGEIIRGEIMDKWTAASIYENIVKRRRDPSILYKRSENRYELRIFPMAGHEARKVKLTFLLPTDWSAAHVSAPVPVDLLTASRNAPDIHIFTWLGEEWRNPQILEYPDSFFKTKSDEKFGNYKSLKLPAATIRNPIHFMLDSPLRDGLYLNMSGESSGGYYQMAFLPSSALQIETAKNVAVLFDYVSQNSSLSKTGILDALESTMKLKLGDKDAFNLFYTSRQTNKLYSSWRAATDENIKTALSALRDGSIGNNSQLSVLLAQAIEFIQTNQKGASILLISNSDQFQSYEAANELVRKVNTVLPQHIPIHIVDFQDRNYQYSRIGNSYFYGNEYFFTNLARTSGGNYKNIRYGDSFVSLLSQVFAQIGGFIQSFDLHPSIMNGYTFGRYNLNESDQAVYLNEPILQIGKFKGSGDFSIDIAGEYQGDIFSKTVHLFSQDVFAADSLVEEMWAGHYIDDLEKQVQSNDVINEIVNISISERVLSIYSAFLCLEPAQGGKVCYDCLDESELVSAIGDDADAASDSLLEAAPNPFNAHTKIHIRLPHRIVDKDLSFEIYNIVGQRIKTFDVAHVDEKRDINILWNGTNEAGSVVASGTYLFVVSGPGYRQSLKLLLMK